MCGDAQAEKFSQVIKTKRVADENMILIKKIRLKRKCEIETIHYSKRYLSGPNVQILQITKSFKIQNLQSLFSQNWKHWQNHPPFSAAI